MFRGLARRMLFIAMPGLVVAVGCATLLLNWRREQTLRDDVSTTLAIFRRHLLFGSRAATVLLAAMILAAVLVHVVTD